MKKNYIFKFILLLIPLGAFVLMSNSFGKTGGFSGSPGDGNNSCSSCHGGGNFGASVSIQTEVPVTGYDFNIPYEVNVEITSSSNSRHGFQLTAERVSDNSKIGSFDVSGRSDIQLTNSGGNVVQTTAGNSQKSWNVNWTSPSSDVGEVRFYVAAVAGDGSGSGGDQVVTATSSYPSLSAKSFNTLAFDMYPNPASNNLSIDLPNGADNARVEFFDNVGRLALTEKITSNNNKININNLATGMYILKVHAVDKVGTKKFIKQ